MTHLSACRPTRRQAALSLTALASLTLTACTGGDDDAAEDPASQSGGAGDEGQDPSDAAGDEVESPTKVDPEDAMATLSYVLPTEEIDGTMTVGVHHLRVKDRTMELLLTFTPEFSGDEAYSLWDLHGSVGGSFHPALFDRVNLKRYDVLDDGVENWYTDLHYRELTSGESQPFWANFAAPEDDIEVVDVGISTGAAFEDVPIEWGSAAPADATTDEDDAE